MKLGLLGRVQSLRIVDSLLMRQFYYYHDSGSTVLAGNIKKQRSYHLWFRHISNRNARCRKCAISCSLLSERIYKLTWLAILLFQKACRHYQAAWIPWTTSTRLTRCSGPLQSFVCRSEVRFCAGDLPGSRTTVQIQGSDSASKGKEFKEIMPKKILPQCPCGKTGHIFSFFIVLYQLGSSNSILLPFSTLKYKLVRDYQFIIDNPSFAPESLTLDIATIIQPFYGCRKV